MPDDLSRRRFLALSASAGAALLAGCGAAASPPPSPSSAPASASPAAGSKPSVSAASSAAAKPSAAASGSAAPAASPAGSSSATGASHVRVGSAPTIVNAGFFIAMERGYYRDEGIDVELVNFEQGAAAMAQPLAADQLDIANADPSAAFLNAIGRGIGIRFVGDGNHSDAAHKGVSFLIRKDLIDSGAVKDYPDLKGKKISAIIKGSSVDRTVHLALAKGNLKPADADLQYIGFPDSVAALGNKSLDGAIEIEPLTTSAIDKNIAAAWKWGSDITGPAQGTVIMYGPNMAKNRQALGKAFMTAYIRGARDYIDAFGSSAKDKQAIVQILVKNTTLKDPALYDKIMLPWFDANGAMNVRSMKDMQQWFVDNSVVQTPADIDATVDTSYAEAAVAKIGKR